MSSCIKDLFDYDLVKVCSKCRIIQLKINFHNDKYSKDGLKTWCKNCCNKYHYENRERELENKIKHYRENRDQIHETQRLYKNNRRQTDPTIKLTSYLRNRTRQAFKAQNLRKNNKSIELLECSQQFLKDWIEFQLYGDMTLENYGKLWHMDHCLPVSSFDLFNEDEMRRCFNWKNLRPMYSKDNIEKGNKINIRLYLLQEIKAKYFLKM